MTKNPEEELNLERKELASFFQYPYEIRSLIYTTNAIEGFNRQLRKVTKIRTVFPTDNSILKLFLAIGK